MSRPQGNPRRGADGDPGRLDDEVAPEVGRAGRRGFGSRRSRRGASLACKVCAGAMFDGGSAQSLGFGLLMGLAVRRAEVAVLVYLLGELFDRTALGGRFWAAMGWSGEESSLNLVLDVVLFVLGWILGRLLADYLWPVTAGAPTPPPSGAGPTHAVAAAGSASVGAPTVDERNVGTMPVAV